MSSLALQSECVARALLFALTTVEREKEATSNFDSKILATFKKKGRARAAGGAKKVKGNPRRVKSNTTILF